MADKHFAEVPFDNLLGYNTIKKKALTTMDFTKYGITETPKLIYNNPLASKSDIDGFVLEGTANISFPEGKLRMENGLSAAQGQKAN